MNETKNLDFFLSFIKADSRCSQENKIEQRRKGIPISELDFPLIRYVFSFTQRLNMINFLRTRIPELNDRSIRDMNEIDEKGYGTGRVGIELILSYEAYLNQIYNLFENLAKLNLFLFNYTGNPPHSFNKQMKQIKSKKLSFDPEYDRIIINEMDWYSEATGIRNNSNHFLVGFNVYDRDEKKNYIPQYMNYNVSERKSEQEFTITRNILEDTDNFYRRTFLTLDSIAKVYLKYIEKDKPCHISFRTEDQMIVREMSYNQFISNDYGKIVASFPLGKKTI